VNDGREDAVSEVHELSDGLGADIAIEAVGVPQTFELCTERPGGHVADIGVHGHPAPIHLETLWIRDVPVTTGVVDTYSTPTLLWLVSSHQVEAERFISRHLNLGQLMEAFAVFGRVSEMVALKVVLTH
jgi:alcohol dehydrogenase